MTLIVFKWHGSTATGLLAVRQQLIVLLLFLYALSTCLSFSTHESAKTTATTATTETQTYASSNSTARGSTTTTYHPPLRLDAMDIENMKRRVQSGRVYQQENFLNEDEIGVLLRDVDRLIQSHKMIPSGLSNTIKGSQQNFGQSDRTTCPVPWWADSLEGNWIVVENGYHNDENDDDDDDEKKEEKEKDMELLNSISSKIQQLRQVVATSLNRPTMNDPSHAHECYYSRSTVGALLKRHMDERHEETKGPRGWMLPSRRSISWLIYLSDVDIQGGELRSYVQNGFSTTCSAGSTDGQVEVGSNQGNLQVGWLGMEDDPSFVLPVYLDSWYNPSTSVGAKEESITREEPFCVLYVLQDGKQIFITKPWINTGAMVTSFADFIKAQQSQSLGRSSSSSSSSSSNGGGLFTSAFYAKNFKLLEDRQLWDSGRIPPGSVIEDIQPKRGSLIMFDSVVVPHEVLVVKHGVRTALAGWFHEQTQPIPNDWL